MSESGESEYFVKLAQTSTGHMCAPKWLSSVCPDCSHGLSCVFIYFVCSYLASCLCSQRSTHVTYTDLTMAQLTPSDMFHFSQCLFPCSGSGAAKLGQVVPDATPN